MVSRRAFRAQKRLEIDVNSSPLDQDRRSTRVRVCNHRCLRRITLRHDFSDMKDGAGEGNRTLVFSLEVGKNYSLFNGRSDIFGGFVPLTTLQNFSLSEWRLRAPRP